MSLVLLCAGPPVDGQGSQVESTQYFAHTYFTASYFPIRMFP